MTSSTDGSATRVTGISGARHGRIAAVGGTPDPVGSVVGLPPELHDQYIRNEAEQFSAAAGDGAGPSAGG